MNQAVVNLVTRLGPRLINTHGKQRLSILIFHRVLPQRDPMRPDEPTVGEFDWQMRILRNDFEPLPLLDAIERLEQGNLPDRAVCVTFDDGYADNALHALPVLVKYAIPATVFVSTGFLNGGRMWNDSIIETIRNCDGTKFDLRELGLECYDLSTADQRLAAISSILGTIKHLDPGQRSNIVSEISGRGASLPNDLMLTDAQIGTMARSGVTIGAHTVSHPILSSVPELVARKEIFESKHYLEDILQQPVDIFAYPNGKPELDYGTVHRDMVSELGFKAAVSTHWGVSTRESDRYQLPRFTPWDRSPLKFTLRLLASYRWIDPLVSKGA